MQKYYLIRHGSKKSEGRRYIGITDVPLSDKGRLEARRIGMWVARKTGLCDINAGNIAESGRPVASIYSSPLSRCIDTAVPIAFFCHLGKKSIKTRNRLIEVDMGEWENVPMDYIKDKFAEEYEARGKDIWNFRTPGGETFKDAGKRFLDCVESIDDDAENIIVVAHVGVIKSALAILSKKSEKNLFGNFMPCGAVTVLEKDDKFRIESVGKTPWLVPDEDTVVELWEKYEVPQNVRRHMEKVAAVLTEAADAVDPSKKRYDRELLRDAALLHDIVRARKNHPYEGRKVLCEEGYELLGMICGEHNSYEMHPVYDKMLSEEDLLYYADMRVSEDRIVSIEERFAKSLEKCGTGEALENHKKRLDKALYIENIINGTEELL